MRGQGRWFAQSTPLQPPSRVRPVINRGAQAFASLDVWDNIGTMSGDRIENAVQRIEAALARIADAADRRTGEGAANPELAKEHASLRETVATQIGELGALIEELER